MTASLGCAASGGVAEWFKAHAWKACIRETVSRVRIPPPPPIPCSLTFAFIRIHADKANNWAVFSPFCLDTFAIVRHNPCHLHGLNNGWQRWRGTSRDCRRWRFRRRRRPATTLMGLGSISTSRRAVRDRGSIASCLPARRARWGWGRSRTQRFRRPAAMRCNSASFGARASTQLSGAKQRRHRRGLRPPVRSRSRNAPPLTLRPIRRDGGTPSTPTSGKARSTTYVEPVFGALPVQGIDTGLVMSALEPIWSDKPETASRLRGRIENILDWAKVAGYRTGENPARWRGHLDKLLPRQSKIARVEHHAALPYPELAPSWPPWAQEGVAARMLEFVILTGARTRGHRSAFQRDRG